MSIEALSWAFNLPLPGPATKLTLLALANYANEDGEAYPSQKTISKKTCLSERAIRNHLVILEKLGILSREGRKRPNGSFTSDLFKLNIGAAPDHQRHVVPQAPDAAPPRHVVPQPAAPDAGPDPSLNTTIRKKPKQKEDEPFLLPDFIGRENWNGFVQMRKKSKKPLTPHAMNLVVRRLKRLMREGHEANAVLDQSTMNGWTSLYEIKEPQKERFDGLQYLQNEAKRRAQEREDGGYTFEHG